MRVALPQLVPIAVRGRDAQAFLQNQLTCDVRDVREVREVRDVREVREAREAREAPGRAIPGALCTNKGRVVAWFELLPWPEGYLLLVDASVAPRLLAHLQTMIFRSKVTVDDLSSALSVTGVLGEGGVEDGPAEPRACAGRGDGLVMRAAGALPRWIVVAPAAAAVAPAAAGWPDATSAEARDAWELADVEAEVPLVDARTSEAFLPQFLNLDQAGGLSFRKGCYAGQEVVARTQHLGEVKRRMYRARCAGPDVPAPGSPLRAIQDDGSERDGGTVVRAARAPDGGIRLLAVVPVAEREAARPVHLGSAAGPRLEFA